MTENTPPLRQTGARLRCATVSNSNEEKGVAIGDE
jgi:hypothetical protein